MAELLFTSIDGVRPINSETYTTQTYNLLRAAILRRELKEGEVYSQDQVSAMLNISRTPVREALLALQKEGYVRFLRGRGFEVVPYDAKDISNISETRLIVEKAAASLAAQRVTDRQIFVMQKNIDAQRECVANVEQFDVQFYLQLDGIFHQQILEASGNSRLSKVTEDMRNQWMRAGYSILQFGESQKEIYQEHLKIFEAIKSHDAAEAEQAMAQHMHNTQLRREAKEKKLS
ncbi:MAG: GntR family transcriptional regulator [Lawsonibacter sp.]